MQFYLAPLEGVTGYIVRNAFAHHFPYIDKFFTPFFPAAKRMNKKIIRDLIPENNPGIELVPQLMVNDAKDMEMMGKQLQEMGETAAYDQIMLAVSDFEKGNLRLSTVLASMQTPNA